MATRNTPPLLRRHGLFSCKHCNHEWESSHVFCALATEKVYYRQACPRCNTKNFPYYTKQPECKRCWPQDCECPVEPYLAEFRGMCQWCDDDSGDSSDDDDDSDSEDDLDYEWGSL